MGTKRKVTVTVRDGVECREGPNGKRYRAWLKVFGHRTPGPYRATRAEAMRDRDRIRHERREQIEQPDRSWTLEDGMRAVIAELERRKRRAATINCRRARFKQVALLIPVSTPLVDIDSDLVEAFIDERLRGGVSIATALSDYRALHSVFTLATRLRIVRTNPCAEARLPREDSQRDIDWFTPAEIADVLHRIRTFPKVRRVQPERDARLIEFLALTGMRIGEASAVQVEDVEPKKRTLRVRDGKTGFRVVRLNDRALELAVDWIGDRESGRLFPITKNGIQSMLWRWAERLGERRLHAHAFRHSHGTAVAANNASAPALARSMGHSSIKMAMHYVHLAGVQEEAIANLDFRTRSEESGGGRP